MTLLKLLRRFLKSNQGTSTLLSSLLLLVMATMGTYMFKALTDLKRVEQERIVHLSNAQALASGVDEYIFRKEGKKK